MFPRIVLTFLLLSCAARHAAAENPRAWVDKNLASLVTLYRHFHSHPGLSFQEKEIPLQATANGGPKDKYGKVMSAFLKKVCPTS